MTKDMKQISAFLKETIDRNGFEYICTNGYRVYQELEASKTAGKRQRVMLLSTLLNLIPKDVKSGICDKKELSALVGKKCGFVKKDADSLADMYLDLFNENHIKEWDSKSRTGLKAFYGKKWKCLWKGSETWYADCVHLEAYCTGEAVLSVKDREVVENELKPMLAENPFLTAEAIRKHYNEMLIKILDDDFSDYVTGDDYYPPVAEDYEYNYADNITEFCKKHGLFLVEYSFEGDSSDYISNSGRF